MNNNELQHWGIPGMKWGVRRYQNKDGSLTSAGRKRADKLKQQYLQTTGKQLKGRALSTKGKITKTNDKKDNNDEVKPISKMSDDELRTKTTRMNLERDYINAVRSMNSLNPKQVSAGKKFVDALVKDVVVPAATDAAKQLVKSYIVKVTNDSFKLEGDYKIHTNNKKKN